MDLKELPFFNREPVDTHTIDRSTSCLGGGLCSQQQTEKNQSRDGKIKLNIKGA